MCVVRARSQFVCVFFWKFPLSFSLVRPSFTSSFTQFSHIQFFLFSKSFSLCLCLLIPLLSHSFVRLFSFYAKKFLRYETLSLSPAACVRARVCRIDRFGACTLSSCQSFQRFLAQCLYVYVPCYLVM